MESFSKWKRLGETRDDAAGEAFDKVARLLNLPYPGGPEIEKLALAGNPDAIAFPRPMIHEKNFDFSFSGLKTSVLYYLKENSGLRITDYGLNSQSAIRNNKSINRSDVAASFQKAAIDVLVAKTIRAAEQFGARSVILCGGVAANQALRNALKSASAKSGCTFFVPEFKYNLDNAAMIGAAGYMAYLRKKKYPLRANGNLRI
jgi:N6-L-threonylcarbamoyladenine synthase